MTLAARKRSFRRQSAAIASLLAFFQKLSPCLVGIEACASAHHWSRELQALGHTVQFMPPAYVKPYVKRPQNDAGDAQHSCGPKDGQHAVLDQPRPGPSSRAANRLTGHCHRFIRHPELDGEGPCRHPRAILTQFGRVASGRAPRRSRSCSISSPIPNDVLDPEVARPVAGTIRASIAQDQGANPEVRPSDQGLAPINEIRA